ncbi:MAG TPA: hypothetical protein VEW04_06680, partial [Allosphingosinicella sp.]|nr:hypothetical protein [Allosphingosinicella sp.]
CLSLAPDSLLWEGDASNPPLTIRDLPPLNLERAPKRVDAARIDDENRDIVQKWLMTPSNKEAGGEDCDAAWQRACGVIFRPGLNVGSKGNVLPDPFTVLNWSPENKKTEARRWPNVEVHSVRTTRRMGPDGQDVRQLVIEVTQRRRGFFDPAQQKREDEARQDAPAAPDFTFRGGATLIFDMFTGKLRYTIRKNIAGGKRLELQRDYLLARATGNLGMAYSHAGEAAREPFAMIHRGGH